MKYTILSILASTLLLSSCYHDNYEERMGGLPVEDCSTPLSSYSADIEPWIDAQCIACHNENFAQAGLDLSSYQLVADNADDILDRISREESDPLLMPQNGPKLDQCKIEGFEQWIADGKPEN